MSTRLLQSVAALGWPVIGQSGEGRPLAAASFGRSDKPGILVVAGVHGDEPTSVEGALELAAYLATHQPTAHCVWIIPVLNPDGVHRGSKNSARDVDLNRNFPAQNFRSTHRPGYFPGPQPLSEPETQALARVLGEVHPVGVVAVHAPLACINYDGAAAAWAHRVAAACGWPAQADIGFATPGSLGSWLGVDRQIPILTIEFPPGEYPEFRVAAQKALQTAVDLDGIR